MCHPRLPPVEAGQEALTDKQKPRKGKSIAGRSLHKGVTCSLGLPQERAVGKLRIGELFKIVALQDRSSDMVKGFPPQGLQECHRDQTEIASGTSGATQLTAAKGPSGRPRMPPGMQAATSGGGLFIISDSSACQGSALCRASPGLAHGCRKVLRMVSRGREDAGGDAAPAIPDRRGGTAVDAVTARVWLACSDPALGHCPALLPGGEPTRLSSPLPAPARGGPGGGCSREPGLCEQPFPRLAAGVCWGGSYCGT